MIYFVARLIPFLLILLILEEALPLVVLYAPFLLPSTCILPNQRARILWKRDDAQYLARDEVRRILAEAGSPSKVLGASVSDMPNELVTSLAKYVGYMILRCHTHANNTLGCLRYLHEGLLLFTDGD